MKRKMLGLLAWMLLFAAPVNAQEAGPVVRVFIDGEQVIFEQPPKLEQGTTLVPFRAVSEKLGFKVGFRAENGEQAITAARGEETVTMYIGNRIANTSGGRVLLEQAPRMEHDLTYVPLRFLAEALHCEVAWDQEAAAVQIRTQGDAEAGSGEAKDAPAAPPADQAPEAGAGTPDADAADVP
ncbi:MULTISPECIES: copper amine oxidase N-terminal domain-containing protein [Paenibacillus]|uniref:copper amine oxidase N-terminal domain-containing protein n=1 Tax=Paenibacillus TaxID=44249 RepID=UPI0022B8B4C8|nr:copper amine oxidase N-terminal domain-containing protein [Paenibacillus caseinilyticus]MCZ8523537.1 copper amine oxidase N-terminal domain-containing protein [Paenibacillus caseinilyticus]